ncbi:MAG: hypothetical protein ACRD6W_12005, partial [Nitrososphaerales archaeon]
MAFVAAVAITAFVGADGLRGTALRAPAADAVIRPGSQTSTWADQPPPTRTPDTPGIAIAQSSDLDLPDPFLFAANGEYYMYLSSAFNDSTHSNVPLLTGVPGDWSSVTDALPTIPSWAVPASAGGNIWDPDVVYFDGLYIMYVS